MFYFCTLYGPVYATSSVRDLTQREVRWFRKARIS
jgi:hypothetical protein